MYAKTLCFSVFVGLLLAGCATGSETTEGAEQTDATEQTQPSEQAADSESAGENAQDEAEPKLTEEQKRKRHAQKLLPDRHDIGKMAPALAEKLGASPMAAGWKRTAKSGEAPLVIFAPMRIDALPRAATGLSTIGDWLETYLVNDTAADVMSLSALISVGKDPGNYPGEGDLDAVADWGRQIGVDYVISGIATSELVSEPDLDTVTYSVTIYAVDVSKAEKIFEADTDLTKQVPK